MGIGPYLYHVDGGQEEVDTISPLLTIYSGIRLDAQNRIVFFNATPLHSQFFSDLGVHLMTEEFRVILNRLSISLVLGGNATVFRYQETVYFRLSAPQGVVFNFRDFFVRSWDLHVGGFLYPLIEGRSYYNVWLRWGPPRLFMELNYISRRETVGNTLLSARAFGLAIGFPILEFL